MVTPLVMLQGCCPPDDPFGYFDVLLDEELAFIVELVEPLLHFEVDLDDRMMVLDPCPGYSGPLFG